MSQGGGYELARSYGNLAGNLLYGFPANSVRMRNLQLGGLLDDDESFVRRNVVEDSFQHRGLPRAGPPGNEAVLPVEHQPDDRVANVTRKAARIDQFIRRVPTVEFADGE